MKDGAFSTFVTLLLMGLVTLLTRGFFFLSSRDWSLPRWVQRGLQYAPIAALAAVVLPEIVMTQGHWSASLHDARPYAALAGALGFWRRHNVLDAIVFGMAVYLPLHLGLGW